LQSQNDIENINEGQFDLPFDMVRGSIEDNLREKMNLLRKRIATIAKSGDESSLEAMRSKLSNVHSFQFSTLPQESVKR
jgi:hypothetical protein